ncbi:MAG: hypothetical protein QOH15_1408 [Gaiellales bacterium]|jgi:hypothetical protein|nr:hypothetical protein [Gaiellales bacterium]
MSNTAPAVPADDAAWPAQARAARISMRPLTAVLTVVLIAVLAVFAGAWLEKRERGSTATASGASAFAGFGRNRPGGGAGAGGAAGGSATTGTVTEVTKKLLYLTSASGALVKVELTAKTTFTRTAASPTGGISLGDTAIVSGTKNAKGVLVATAVIATAKGVTATVGGQGGGFGGFGGGGGGGGGATPGG